MKNYLSSCETKVGISRKRASKNIDLGILVVHVWIYELFSSCNFFLITHILFFYFPSINGLILQI